MRAARKGRQMTNPASSTNQKKKESDISINISVGFAVVEELSPLDAHAVARGKTRSELIREAMADAGLFKPPRKTRARKRAESRSDDHSDHAARPLHKPGHPFRVATAETPQQYVTVRLARALEAKVLLQHVLADGRANARPLLIREALERYGLFRDPPAQTTNRQLAARGTGRPVKRT